MSYLSHIEHYDHCATCTTPPLSLYGQEVLGVNDITLGVYVFVRCSVVSPVKAGRGSLALVKLARLKWRKGIARYIQSNLGLVVFRSQSTRKEGPLLGEL